MGHKQALTYRTAYASLSAWHAHATRIVTMRSGSLLPKVSGRPSWPHYTASLSREYARSSTGPSPLRSDPRASYDVGRAPVGDHDPDDR